MIVLRQCDFVPKSPGRGAPRSESKSFMLASGKHTEINEGIGPYERCDKFGFYVLAWKGLFPWK